MKRERKTRLEIIERQKLEADATEGTVSDEQVEEAVNRRKAEIQAENDLQNAALVLWLQTAKKSIQAKNN